MKKFLVTALAFAALTGAAVAGEREHDSRLSDPNFNSLNVGSTAAPSVFVSKFAVVKSTSAQVDDAETRRLDAKNGYSG